METKLLELFRDLQDQSETLNLLKERKARAVQTIQTIDQEIEEKKNIASMTEAKIYSLIQKVSA